MNVRRFLADNMQDAMVKIKNECGPDAVILSSRNIRKKGIKGFFSKPLVEVMVGYEKSENLTYKNTSNIAKEDKKGNDNDKISKLEEKITDMNKMMESLVNTVRSNSKISYDKYSSTLTFLLNNLVENDVNEELAVKIADETNSIVSRKQADEQEVMAHLIMERLGEGKTITLKKYKRQVVILAGPTGIGKTTTVAKLAADFSLNKGAKVGLITSDTYRIAAVEQLKTYAEIMNIPLDVLYDVENVQEILQKHEDKDIVFIDTAGRSPGDEVQEKEITTLIEKSGATEVYLVLSATTSYKGCLHIVKNYSFLNNYDLIITKVDETQTKGSILNIVDLTGKSVAYLGNGQNVPDDIEEFNPAKIVNSLIGKDVL